MCFPKEADIVFPDAFQNKFRRFNCLLNIYGLRKEVYADVKAVCNGAFDIGSYTIVLLDLMIPQITGMNVMTVSYTHLIVYQIQSGIVSIILFLHQNIEEK